MTDAYITRADTPSGLRRILHEWKWPYITASVNGGEHVVTALVCPFCSTMVPPHDDDRGVSHKDHHIRYHVEMWELMQRVAHDEVYPDCDNPRSHRHQPMRVRQ